MQTTVIREWDKNLFKFVTVGDENQSKFVTAKSGPQAWVLADWESAITHGVEVYWERGDKFMRVFCPDQLHCYFVYDSFAETADDFHNSGKWRTLEEFNSWRAMVDGRE